MLLRSLFLIFERPHLNTNWLFYCILEVSSRSEIVIINSRGCEARKQGKPTLKFYLFLNIPVKLAGQYLFENISLESQFYWVVEWLCSTKMSVALKLLGLTTILFCSMQIDRYILCKSQFFCKFMFNFEINHCIDHCIVFEGPARFRRVGDNKDQLIFIV